LATKTSESVVPQFADAFDAYKKSPHSSKQCQLFVKESKGSLVEYTYNDDSWKARASYCLVEDGKYYLVSISSQSSWDRNGKEIPKKDIKYNIKYNTVVEINKDGIMFKRLNCTVNPKYASGYYGYGYVDRYIVDKEDKNDLTLDQINSIVRELWVKCENGAEFRVGSL
jgi:hypothetical protein